MVIGSVGVSVFVIVIVMKVIMVVAVPRLLLVSAAACAAHQSTSRSTTFISLPPVRIHLPPPHTGHGSP